MRDSSKSVSFEFEFAYSYMGQIVKGNTVTVVEPSFADRAVYRQMKAWMAEAFKGLSKMRDGEVKEKVEDVAPAAADAPEIEPDAYLVLSLGLEGSRFADMAAYIEKVLTNNKRLAFCGDDAEHGVPITDIIWQAIAREGGMESVEKVCSAFAGFFMAGSPPPTKTSSGSEIAPGSLPDPLAPSPIAKRKR